VADIPHVHKCVWCGKAPLTEEHVIARWIRKDHMPKGRLKIIRRIGEGQDARIIEHKWREVINMKAKVVCKSCNEVWHNDIDELARPRLHEMIEGEDTPLTWDEQFFLTRWAVRTAVMFAYANVPPIYLPESWRYGWYPNLLLRTGLYIFIGKYDASTPITAYSIATTVKPEGSPEDIEGVHRDGYFLTLTIKNLCLQVGFFAINGVRHVPILVPGANPEHLDMLWPSRGHDLLWPSTSKVINDDILMLYAKRFTGFD
jgi:hypothetical protein